METDTRGILLNQIDEPQFGMRTDIDRDEIFDLANDIKKNGLINPITVRPIKVDGVPFAEWRKEHPTLHTANSFCQYEVVAGHRRLLAHRYGGIVSIKCVVRELTDDEAFAIMTSENLARTDVHPVDEATHTKRLWEMWKGDVAKVCDIVNRSRDWVESRLVIADMPEDLKQELRTGKIKLGVALALAEITDDLDRVACLKMAVSQGASVVVAQYWLAQWRAGLFGHATENIVPDSNAPNGGRRVVMLRCSVDGKEHPAEDCTSLLVARKNVGYIEALREHLDSLPGGAVSSGGGESAKPEGEAVATPG